MEETVEETGEEKVSKKSLTQAPRIKVQTSEEIPAPKIALANMEEIQNTMRFISGQVFSDEEEVKKEIKRIGADEEEITRIVATEKSPFPYGAKEHQNSRRADPESKTAKNEELILKSNDYRINTPRIITLPNGSEAIILPEEPLSDSFERERKMRELIEAQERQNKKQQNPQDLPKDFQRQLDQLRNDIKQPNLSEDQLDDFLRRYREFLLNPSTPSDTRGPLPESLPGIEEVRSSTQDKKDKQDTVISSLKETISELQEQGQQDRVRRILDDVVVPKLRQASDVSTDTSRPNFESYRDTLNIFSNVDGTDIPKYYKDEFKTIDSALKNKVQDIEKLLEESVLNALNEDFSGNLSSAVANLNRAADMLKAQVLILSKERQLSPQRLVAWALDKNKTPDERFAAIQILVSLMEDPTTGVGIRPERKQAILDFLNTEYPAYLAKQKEDCEKTGQTTLALDEEKLKQLLSNMANVQDWTSTPHRSLVSQKLEHAKELLVKIKEKVAAERASGNLTNQELQLCDEADADCNAGFAAVDKSKNILAAPAATGNVTSSTAEAKDQTSSLEIDDRKNQ